MQRSDLHTVISDPSKINTVETTAIDDLIHRFPYCSTLYIIRSRQAIENEELGADKLIRRSAATVVNRKHLHDFLFKPLVSTNPSSFESTSVEQEDLSTEHIAPEEGEIQKNIESESINKTNPLDQQILTSAINSSISLEVDDEFNFDDLDSLQSKTPLQKAHNTPIDEDHSFEEWIRIFGGEVEDSSSEEHQELFANRTAQKQEFYNAAKMAKLSVQENDDLVTETLANIYADQENYEKAINAFEKLKLKYPEKRIYFAGRIKEIQIQQKK